MPKYTKQLLAFYDILGFSAFVRAHPDAKEVDQLFKRITQVASVDKGSTKTQGQRFSHFSDTVIRTMPFVMPSGIPNRTGILYRELLHAIHFQMELVWKGYPLVRGAITIGDAFHGAREIYGPAVIRGYELEKDVAVFPRIIIDPEVIQELHTSKRLCMLDRSIEDNMESCYHLMKRGDDGIWFVDYLRLAQSEADYEDYYPEFLARHRKMILKHLADASSVNCVVRKYLWLADYHNTTVRSWPAAYFKSMGVDRKSLIITHLDAHIYHPPISQRPSGI